MGKRKCIIVDIDGCISDSEMCHLRQKEIEVGDFSWFHNDCNDFKDFEWVKHFFKAFASIPGIDILFITSRHEKIKENTIAWLDKHIKSHMKNKPYYLYMREGSDTRAACEFKKGIYNSEIKDSWDVLFAIDDRKSVHRMWADVGVTSMLVYNHDSEYPNEMELP